MVTWSVLGVTTLVVGGALGLLMIAVWRNHHGPGTTALTVFLVGLTVWTLAYGTNVLVFDAGLSRLLEIPFWIAGEVMTVTYLFFALAFTGRTEYLTRRNAVLVSLIPATTATLAVLNSLSLAHPIWTDYRVVETLGAAVRTFDPAPWLYVKSTYNTVLFGAGMLMFIEEILIERTLYRSQSIAIVTGTIIPLSGYNVWLLNLGPYPQIDFSPLLAASTVVLWGYAIFVADLFDTAPAIRRLGHQSTIDDLEEAIVIVNDEGMVIDLNESATALLGCSRAAALKEPLNALLDGDRLQFDEPTQVLAIEVAGGKRTFRATIDPTTDGSGELIGQTILFYDITVERRREQRLAVLNRILRHNLRNDVTAVIGFSEQIQNRTTDDQIMEWSESITQSATELVDLGEKARAFEAALKDDVVREPVALRPIVEEIVAEYRDAYPAASISSDVPKRAVAEADPELVRLIVSNVVENALEHHDGERPQVRVRVGGAADDDTVVLEVIDDGPGIPEIELATLREGTEEPLQHSQGIGLWVVTWCVRALGGTVDFDADASGTTVAVELEAAAAQQRTEQVAV